MSSPVALYASALLTGGIFTVGVVSTCAGGVVAGVVTETISKSWDYHLEDKIKRIVAISLLGAASALAVGAVLSFGTGLVVALPFFPKVTSAFIAVIGGFGACIGYDRANAVPATGPVNVAHDV